MLGAHADANCPFTGLPFFCFTESFIHSCNKRYFLHCLCVVCVLESLSIERRREKSKVGQRREKITSCLLAEGEEPRKSNGENGSRNLWCTGANQVQEWRPCENWPLEREGEKDSG